MVNKVNRRKTVTNVKSNKSVHNKSIMAKKMSIRKVVSAAVRRSQRNIANKNSTSNHKVIAKRTRLCVNRNNGKLVNKKSSKVAIKPRKVPSRKSTKSIKKSIRSVSSKKNSKSVKKPSRVRSKINRNIRKSSRISKTSINDESFAKQIVSEVKVPRVKSKSSCVVDEKSVRTVARKAGEVFPGGFVADRRSCIQSAIGMPAFHTDKNVLHMCEQRWQEMTNDERAPFFRVARHVVYGRSRNL